MNSRDDITDDELQLFIDLLTVKLRSMGRRHTDHRTDGHPRPKNVWNSRQSEELRKSTQALIDKLGMIRQESLAMRLRSMVRRRPQWRRDVVGRIVDPDEGRPAKRSPRAS